MMSAKLAMPTIDIGGAQLSMHSIREQCSTTSVDHAIKLYQVSATLTIPHDNRGRYLRFVYSVEGFDALRHMLSLLINHTAQGLLELWRYATTTLRYHDVTLCYHSVALPRLSFTQRLAECY